MNVSVLLNRIRPVLVDRIVQRIARGAGVREKFKDQLERFFDFLEQAIETGDPGWLNTVLFDWATSRTESDLERGDTNISSLLNQMIAITFEVAEESLPGKDAISLMRTLVSHFTYGLEVVSRHEMETRVDYISNELVGVQNKLEILDRSKSNFIAVAAHELKTPLTLIEGYTSMLRDSLPEPERDNITPMLQGVDTGVRRLQEIVDDMIDVSLIDNNLLSLNFQPVWPDRLMKLLEQEANAASKERKIVLAVRLFPGAEKMIFADPERLYQALRNIILNAIKFTPDGGSVTISGRTLPGFIEITIADTGIGISPENQAVIFEKFGQVGQVSLHSSGKTKFKGGGPGLGLPISQGIIEAHGGTIWVESEGYDEMNCPGSTFHVLIPARSEPSDPKLAKLFDLSSENKEQPHVK